MNEFFVLKNTNTGKYYSDDKEFIEPNKQFAKKLRAGQAKSLLLKFNRFTKKSYIVIEPVE